MEELHKKYYDKGLIIIGCPCNQFGNQDPGTNKEISAFATTSYGVDFIMTEKIEVNGENAHPMYEYLKKQKKGILGDKIKWNFTKFLIDRQGNVVDRYASATKPETIEKTIIKLLG